MSDLNRDIGQRIAKLRRLQGMTQELFAEKMEVSVKHISSVERGASALSLEKLICAGSILNCSLDYLIKGETSEVSALLPNHVIETLSSHNTGEIELLLEYLNLYDKLRKI